MDLFSFVKPKNELEGSAEKQQNVPFVPEEMWVKCPKCNTLLLTCSHILDGCLTLGQLVAADDNNVRNLTAVSILHLLLHLRAIWI